MVTAPRHQVFVSYHHELDQWYRNAFEMLFTRVYSIMVSKSVQIGDIPAGLSVETVRQKVRDEYLRDSTVTVVLVGADTWKRKHVDWEIGASIRQTRKNPRSGLLGILLPTYHFPETGKYDPYTIPPRLHYNIECRFARMYLWSSNPIEVSGWIHEAFERRAKVNPNNSYTSFANNRSGNRWSP